MAGNDRPTKAERRDEARRKAAELRARQEREQQRNKIIRIGLLVVAVLLIGGGIFAVVKQQADVNANKEKYSNAAMPRSSTPPDVADVTVPSTADPDAVGIPISTQGVGTAASGGVTVDVYMDFMCPGCAQFERTQGEQIAALLDPKSGEDDVTVVYHPVSILDRLSQGTYYSSRAANAVSVVADQDPEHFLAMVMTLFAPDTQPAENSHGLTDEKLAEVAQGLGVPSKVTDQFTKTADFEGKTLRTFIPWTTAVTFSIPVNPTEGVPTTPTVLVNGERWDGWASQPIADRVAEARTGSGGTGGAEG